MYYIDIHTHKTRTEPEIISILNIRLGYDDNISPVNCLYSIGLHPWDIKDITDIELLDKITDDNNLLAIGECGFDKNINIPFSIQKNIFIKHVELSEKYHKPLIIHCVKYFNEIISLRIELKPTENWIIHGFCGSSQLAKQLIESGFILSFGKVLFDERKNMKNLFCMIHDNLFFLETDESTKSIENIYLRVSEIKEISVENLKKLIYNNYKNVFKSKL